MKEKAVKKIALLLGMVAVAFGVCWAQERTLGKGCTTLHPPGETCDQQFVPDSPGDEEEESGGSAHTVPGGGEKITLMDVTETWTYRIVDGKEEINPAFIAALKTELGLDGEKPNVVFTERFAEITITFPTGEGKEEFGGLIRSKEPSGCEWFASSYDGFGEWSCEQYRGPIEGLSTWADWINRTFKEIRAEVK